MTSWWFWVGPSDASYTGRTLRWWNASLRKTSSHSAYPFLLWWLWEYVCFILLSSLNRKYDPFVIVLFIYFDIFHFGPSEKNFGEFWFKIKVYSCNKIPLQMSSAKMAAILFRSRCVKIFMCFRYRLDELGCFGQLCSMSAGVIIDAWALHAVRFGYRNPKWRWYTKLWYVTTVTMRK